jgi:hypothetical protein
MQRSARLQVSSDSHGCRRLKIRLLGLRRRRLKAERLTPDTGPSQSSGPWFPFELIPTANHYNLLLALPRREIGE